MARLRERLTTAPPRGCARDPVARVRIDPVGRSDDGAPAVRQRREAAVRGAQRVVWPDRSRLARGVLASSAHRRSRRARRRAFRRRTICRRKSRPAVGARRRRRARPRSREANEAYLERFGFIFIVCATGKSAEEMLALLRDRLSNDRATELRIAAEEQAKITALRFARLRARQRYSLRHDQSMRAGCGIVGSCCGGCRSRFASAAAPVIIDRCESETARDRTCNASDCRIEAVNRIRIGAPGGAPQHPATLDAAHRSDVLCIPDDRRRRHQQPFRGMAQRFRRDADVAAASPRRSRAGHRRRRISRAAARWIAAG